MDINTITSDDGRGEKTACDQCAGCCTGGGPILRQADAHLVRSGKIPASFLYTIRKGERLFDRDLMKMVPVKTDLIKIKIIPDTFECRFLEPEKTCSIYATRPMECRAFKCWDTKQIEAQYDEDPLERKGLLGDVEGLWPLIVDHEKRCSYDEVADLCSQLQKDTTQKETLSRLNEILAYDRSLRTTLVEKGGVNEEMLEFLVGRPLTTTLMMFEMKVEEKEGQFTLTSTR